MTNVVKVFGLENGCTKCAHLKEYLDEIGIGYVSLNMEDAENMATLFDSGVYTYNAPVLEVDGVFITSDRLFNGGELDEVLVVETLKLNRGVTSDD